MCGIIGFVDKNNRLSLQEKKRIGEMMLQKIEYRGRDSSGIYNHRSVTIGHNRLAIIDTSEKAKQPFLNTNNTLVMSYNGEIYNHLELRGLTKKHTYNSTSDAETFISLYEDLKEKIFGLIRGMFAVSFYDIKNKEIVLAVDQFGIKPLYYLDTPDWFVWSSELKVFKLLPNVSFLLNKSKIFEYGIFRTTIGSQTLLKDINRMNPGEFLRYQIKDYSIKKFKYSYTGTVDGEIENLLKLSVSEHILSDVPIGLQLSGGIDSSLISVLATQCLRYLGQKDIHSFSIGLTDPEWNEFIYSREISKLIKTTHHEIVFPQKEFCEMLPIVTYHLDEPISYPNTIPMMLLTKEARKYVKVLLSGEGADEIFGGYLRYNKLIQKELSSDTLVFSNSFCSPEEISRIFILDKNHNISERNILVKNTKKFTLVHKLCFYDLKTFLPSLLLRQDKMGMTSNLENRFPFLDPRLVSSALKLPDEQKLNTTETKIFLKKIARKYLPKNIVYRKKCGFGLPISDWLKDDFGLGKYLNIFRQPVIKRPYLNYNEISKCIQEHLLGKKDNSEVLWVLITLEIWVKIFIEQKNPDNIWGAL